jgi:hypothetical protein
LARTLVVSTPLSIGDIVGRAFRIFRQHLLLIGKTLALPTIFLALGRIAVLVGASFGVKYMNNPAAGALWFCLAGAGAFTMFGAMINFWIRQMALVRFLCGYSPSYEDARLFLKDKIYSLIALSISSFMASLGAAILWMIVLFVSMPGLKAQGLMPVISSVGLAIGILGMAASLIMISIVTQLVMTALALEKGELGPMIAKSFSLTMHAFARSIVFLVVTVASIMLLAYPLSLPASLLVFGHMMVSGALTGAPEPNVPMWIQVFNSVWETIVNMVIGPVYYLSYGLFYTDLCVRQEGVDLIERLDEVEAEDQAKRLSSSGY